MQVLWAQAQGKPPAEALRIYEAIVKDATNISEDDQKVKEAAINAIADIYGAQGALDSLKTYIVSVRPLISYMPQARIAKSIRLLYDKLVGLRGGLEVAVGVVQEIVDWCVAEKRTFLKHRMQTKLAGVYLELRKYVEALKILDVVGFEVRKLEDMLLLVDIHLVETKVYLALENILKAKAALTAVKTASTSVNLHPAVQAEIDLLSGYVATEEHDYATGYSYFYEAFQGLTNLKDGKAAQVLLYMLMCKIALKANDDALSIVNSKMAVSHQGPQVRTMAEIAVANKNKSVVEFERCIAAHRAEFQDPLMRVHINHLYTQLLEDNIKKIIEPYSRVEIAHVAKLIGLPYDKVLDKYGCSYPCG